jgi:hypothetical protein
VFGAPKFYEFCGLAQKNPTELRYVAQKIFDFSTASLSLREEVKKE